MSCCPTNNNESISILNKTREAAVCAQNNCESATESAEAAATSAYAAAVSAGQAAASAALSGIYLGPKATAPTTDNEGNPLQEGMQYFNTVDDVLYIWNGTSWQSSAFNEFTDFTATGTTTARDLVTRFADVVNVKDFGAVGDGVTDDTAAIQAADTYALNKGTLFFPDGVYICGRINLADGNRYWYSTNATIKVKQGTYTNNIAPLLSGSFGPYKIIFDGITFDQNWSVSDGYPAGFSRNDQKKASTWGGGSWIGEFYGNQTGTIEFRNCNILNVFRGFLVSLQKSFLVNGCNINAENSIGDSGFAAELCQNVEYIDNTMVSKNWFTSNPPVTGTNALFGNSCNNVIIKGNYSSGFQLVFHATDIDDTQDIGVGRNCIVSNNIIDYPIADTAFYRWKHIIVSDNIIKYSGDMGIAVSSSSYATVTGNVIKNTHVGGIGITDCQSVVVSNNSIFDIAQDYSVIQNIANRYAGGAGAWKSGITCDYQSGGQKGVECIVSGNSIGWTTLPPVSDTVGVVRAEVYGIYIESSPNTLSQSTFSVTGNYVQDDYANMPSHFVVCPSHRFYLAPSSRIGTPILGETFSDGAGNSFILIADFGDGNLAFLKKLIGTIPNSTPFTGDKSGCILVSATFPQLTWTKITGAGNFDWTTTYENQNIGV